MKTRHGFTLIEVMIALLIGSVVVLLAYATLRAGLDVQERVTASREADETATAMRAMLGDALRHAVAGDARDLRGLHTDADAAGALTGLGFVSRGIMAPLGGSAQWQIGLASDSAGVTLSATPLDSLSTPLRFTSRGSRSFAVRFLALEDGAWRTDWNDPTRLPSAVEVRFLDAAGRESMATLVARTAPVSGL